MQGGEGRRVGGPVRGPLLSFWVETMGACYPWRRGDEKISDFQIWDIFRR